MSFQDIERGQPARRPSGSSAGGGSQDAQFKQLQQSLSLQVFKINANVQGMLKLVDQLGTARDTGAVRKGLHDLTETTRDMVKRGTDDLKKLAGAQANLTSASQALRTTDFHAVAEDIARPTDVPCGVSTGTEVECRETKDVGGILDLGTNCAALRLTGLSVDPNSGRQQQQQLQLQSQLSPADLAYQQSLIQEREDEIREIETGIHELNEIFRDLGTLVVEQGSMIDMIDVNVTSVAVNTAGANEELTTAADYQRKAGKRALCLMLVLVIVTCVVLVA
ncbi:hypothetical protein FRB97_008844 [Tulasnella sp. 331]|nr:hypothetical protein FRB97_008844 [Tulasnella sp. 331]